MLPESIGGRGWGMESVYSGKSCKWLLARESESASSVLSHVDSIFPLRDVRRKALYLCGGSCLFVTKPCLTFCDPMDCSMPRFPDLHCLLEFLQIHVHWDGDAIQPSHPLLPPSLPALSLFQCQGLFQSVCSSHQVAKVLELQPQHQSFQQIFRLIPLGLTGLISLLSKGLSRVFSSTTTEKHQFFGT